MSEKPFSAKCPDCGSPVSAGNRASLAEHYNNAPWVLYECGKYEGDALELKGRECGCWTKIMKRLRKKGK